MWALFSLESIKKTLIINPIKTKNKLRNMFLKTKLLTSPTDVASKLTIFSWGTATTL